MNKVYEFDNSCGRVGFIKNGNRIDKNQVLRDLNLMANHIKNQGCDLEEISGIQYDKVSISVNDRLFNNGKAGFLG